MKSTTGRLVVAAATLLAVAACGPTRPGAAAVVGDTRITVDALHALTDRSLADPAAAQRFTDKAQFMRRELSQLIEHQLLEVSAAKLGVTVTQGDVDKRLATFAEQSGGLEQLKKDAAGSGVAPADLNNAVRDLVLSDLLADKLTADQPVDQAALRAAYQSNIDNYDQVRSAHILVADEKTARSILAQVKADPSKFADLAAKNSTDPGSKDKGGELGFAGRSKLVKPFSDAIFNGKPGDLVLVKTEFGWHVIKIEERKTTTFAEATPELRRSVLGDARGKALSAYLAETAKALKISVSPRFGKWDAASHSVVAGSDKLSTPEGGSATPAPTPSG